MHPLFQHAAGLTQELRARGAAQVRHPRKLVPLRGNQGRGDGSPDPQGPIAELHETAGHSLGPTDQLQRGKTNRRRIPPDPPRRQHAGLSLSDRVQERSTREQNFEQEETEVTEGKPGQIELPGTGV